MIDVQKDAPSIPIPIDHVGVRNVMIPLSIKDRANGQQHTVAKVDLSVDLPSSYKGTHMSRFIESLERWGGVIGYRSLHSLLESVKEKLGAGSARVVVSFPYFIRKKAPASGADGYLSYDCVIKGELDGDGVPSFVLSLSVPVMTVCPCSKAISDEGAHSQRALVRMDLRLKGFGWIEDFVEIAESSASSPVYTVLKRPDEKYVTEHAFANPCFVEDVVRGVANKLMALSCLEGFRVEVESMESIHNHNAVASIEKNYFS